MAVFKKSFADDWRNWRNWDGNYSISQLQNLVLSVAASNHDTLKTHTILITNNSTHLFEYCKFCVLRMGIPNSWINLSCKISRLMGWHGHCSLPPVRREQKRYFAYRRNAHESTHGSEEAWLQACKICKICKMFGLEGMLDMLGPSHLVTLSLCLFLLNIGLLTGIWTHVLLRDCLCLLSVQ